MCWCIGLSGMSAWHIDLSAWLIYECDVINLMTSLSYISQEDKDSITVFSKDGVDSASDLITINLYNHRTLVPISLFYFNILKDEV